MSIVIPCPQCGRELKLPDRSMLGRKGKCPKCSHTFVLEEPPAITLELATPDTATSRVRNQPEARSTPALASTAAMPDFAAASSPAVPATSSPGTFAPPEFADLERVVKSKGTAARLKEIQKKNAQRRNIGLGITGVAIVVVGAITFFTSGKSSPKTDPAGVLGQGESSATVDGDEHAVDIDPTSTSYAQRGTPTKGKPIELRYIPFGTQVVFNLRPAELWIEGGLGEEIRFCIPPVAKLVETTLNDLFKCKPEQVEELLICLIPGIRGSMPDVAAVAHLIDEKKRSDLIDQFGQRVDSYEQPIFVSGSRAYMIPDPKTLVVCPKSLAEEMVQAFTSNHPVEQIDPLLPMTDRDRQVTIIVTPMTLTLQDSWFPENVRPLVKGSVDWLGDDIETMSWSFHLTDELFYSEILLRNKGLPTKKFERAFKSKLARLAGNILPIIEQMNPKEQGKRMVIGRLPAMVEVFSMATIFQHEPHHLQLVTPLPDRAAANLVLGTLLAWDESTRTDYAKEKPVPTEGPKLPALIADRLQMKIPVDFRNAPFNEAFLYISGEIGTQIDIDGDSLKLGGFTKNIKQTFQMDSATVQQIIIKIFEESVGVNAVDPTKNLVIIVDETKKRILVTTTAGADAKGLKPFEFKKG